LSSLVLSESRYGKRKDLRWLNLCASERDGSTLQPEKFGSIMQKGFKKIARTKPLIDADLLHRE
jgi:hypothetical protein